MRVLKFLALFLLIPSVASAQSIYGPEFCDFAITFPEQPYETKRCEGENSERCYNMISFTKVFEMSTTVNFRVICNPISKDVREQYSGEVMAATLRAMTKKTVAKQFDTSFSEEENYKMAGLVGEGMVGRTPTIYIAQLWIGDRSAFSVEAELIGNINQPADQLYSDVLRSIGHKDDLAKRTEAAKKAEEKSSSPAAETKKTE